MRCLLACLSAAWFALAAPLAAAEPAGPIHHVRLERDRLADGGFAPLAGAAAARPVGPVTYSPDAPHTPLLDGKGQYFVVGDQQSLAYPTAALSVAAWAIVDAPREWGGLVSAIQDNGDYERGFLLGFRHDKFCFGVTSQSRLRLTYLTEPTARPLGVWRHVAGVYDGAVMRLYVDGQLAAESREQSGPIVYAPKFVYALAAYVDDNELYPLAGQLAEAAVWDRALAAEEVAARYAAERARYATPAGPAATIAADAWPTYQRDYERSGVSPAELPLPLAPAWTWRAPAPPTPAWPPPAKQDFWNRKENLPARVTFDRAAHVVSDGRRVVLGTSSTDEVIALDLASGRPLWSFATEGPVRLAPTLANGHVYFGSDDGHAYCVDLESGQLVWRVRGAPSERRLPGNSRMISQWPVRSGVLVEDGQARFAAGLFPEQGAWQVVVDAATGRELARGEIAFSPQGYMQRRGRNLLIGQGRAPDALLTQLERRGDAAAALAVRQDFPHALIAAGAVRFAGGAGRVAALVDGQPDPVWQAAVEGAAYSLAVAGGALLVSTDAGVVTCFRPAVSSPPGAAAALDPPTFPPPASEPRHPELLAAVREVGRGWGLLASRQCAELAPWLAENSALQWVVVEDDPAAAAALRRGLAARRIFPDRVAVQHATGEPTPYARWLFNIVVVDAPSDLPSDKTAPRWSAAETARLVRPDGGRLLLLPAASDTRPPADAVAAWRGDVLPADVLPADALPADAWRAVAGAAPQWIRGPLPGAGQWSHMYAEPGNTACSGDELVRGPLALQWFGPPGPRDMVDRHHRTTPPLSVAGRLFIPGDDRIFAVDAYNGALLWERETPYFRRVAAMRDAGNMAAARDRLYAVAAGQCLVLEPQTGEELAHWPPPPHTDGQPRHWGYLAWVGERLYGSTTRPGASRGGHSRRQIDETFWDHVPIVASDSLFALDRTHGELAWRYEPRGAILNPTITLGDGAMYFVESHAAATLAETTGRVKLTDFLQGGASLVALDAATGRERWRSDVGDLRRIEHHLYLMHADGKLVAVGSRNERNLLRVTVRYDTAAFDAATGRPLWHVTQDQGQGPNGDHGEQDHHPTIVGGVVYVEPYAYDLATGQQRGDWKLARGGHGCGALSASAGALFFRAGNPTMCDLATGEKSKVTTVTRPGCWINTLPAGGLLLIPEASSGCTCNFAVQSSLGFAPVEPAP